MSRNTIGNQIVALLQPLVTSGKVKQLDQFSSGKVLGYPRIQVLSQGVNTEYLTNRERLATYAYNIVVTQEKTVENIGAEDAEIIMDKLIDEIISLLDAEINDGTPLGGLVDFIRPVITEETEANEELPLIRHTIRLEAIKTV